MFSIPELLTILVILFLNFAIVVLFRNRIVVVASVMIANLVTILFYSMIIADYQNLKELIIATIIYSLTILALISSTNHIDQVRETHQNKIISCLIVVIALTIGGSGFYLLKNVSNSLPDNNVSRSDVARNDVASEFAASSEVSDGNTDRQKLKNSILFKHSTDAILIIVGVMTFLLLGSKYRNRESNI